MPTSWGDKSACADCVDLSQPHPCSVCLPAHGIISVFLEGARSANWYQRFSLFGRRVWIEDVGCGGGTRTHDLQGMSLTCYRCTTPPQGPILESNQASGRAFPLVLVVTQPPMGPFAIFASIIIPDTKANYNMQAYAISCRRRQSVAVGCKQLQVGPSFFAYIDIPSTSGAAIQLSPCFIHLLIVSVLGVSVVFSDILERLNP